MNIKINLIVLCFLNVLMLVIAQNSEKDWEAEKKKAEKFYNIEKYDEAVIIFREIILSSNDETLKIEAYFWLAKAYMGADKLDEAEEYIEYYIKNFHLNGKNYPEAVYQKGRLLFLQEHYQEAIEQLNIFKKNYSTHELVSNAYYWIGESLYALGQYDDSAFYFNIIIAKYPGSVKREACIYKLRLIEHKKSELALQNLLKWSQEQYISSLNQFRIKEKTLQEALKRYKDKDSTFITEEEKEKLNKLYAENEALLKKITELEQKIESLKTNISNEEYLNKMKQLELKEQLLNAKEETLNMLEKELREKEKALEKK